MEHVHGQHKHTHTHTHDHAEGCGCGCHHDHQTLEKDTRQKQSLKLDLSYKGTTAETKGQPLESVPSLFETPAIYSVNFTMQTERAIQPDRMEEKLTHWIHQVRDWAQEQKFLVGHIKVFVESEENLWLACTKRTVNRKHSARWPSTLINKATINVTSIILGATPEELERFAKARLERAVEELKS